MNVINHDDFVKLLNDLPECFVQKIVSLGQGSKIAAGNDQELIVVDLFNNLGLKDITASRGAEIENTTRKSKKSKVDVTVYYKNEPFIAIDVKNGGANGTESAEARAVDVVARVTGANKKRYSHYFYLYTPQSNCASLEHVNIAIDKLSPLISCKLLNASMKEGDKNLQILCDVIKQRTNQNIDTSTIMRVYKKLYEPLSLKDKIRNKSADVNDKSINSAAKRSAKEAKRSAKEAKRTALIF